MSREGDHSVDPVGAIGLIAVLVLLLAAGSFRIAPVDIPWHLATGRLIVEQGQFPVTNTFSWTWADYPLYQQYPLFQAGIYAIVRWLGWPALSVAIAASWLAAVLAWMRAAGPLARAADHPLLWLLVVVGVQRHLVARPEVLTLLWLGGMLLCFEAYRRGRTVALVGVVLCQWAMVLSHQMFPLGLALQGVLLVHVLASRHLAGRLPLSGEDAGLPVRPLLATLAASVAVLGLSPLGPQVYLVPLETLRTLTEQGQATTGGAQAQELAPVWTDPIATAVILFGVPIVGVGLWRARGRWQVLDLGIWCMGLAMVLLAVRGIPFFALCTGVVATRSFSAVPPAIPRSAPIRRASAVAATLFSGLLVWVLYQAEPAYLQIQRGLGRSIGEWADDTIDFLKASPPPGRMLNLGWVAGNPMIWGLYPEQQVFVDPRWEAYPKPFLHRAIRAMEDPETLHGILDEYQPGFIVAEMRLPEVQTRVGELVASGEWSLVHVDTLLVVLVKHGPESRRYLAEHTLAVDDIELSDWLSEYPVLQAQQQIRVARLWRALGREDRAAPLEQAAREHSDNPAVAADLRTLQ